MKLDTVLDLYVKSPYDVIYMIDADMADKHIDDNSKSKWDKIIIFMCEKEDLKNSAVYSKIMNAEVNVQKTPGGFICVNTDRTINKIENIRSYFCTVSM